MDPVAAALEACPFLSLLSKQQGEAAARRLASTHLSKYPSLDAALSVHGPGGAVPLARFDGPKQPEAMRSGLGLGQALGLVKGPGACSAETTRHAANPTAALASAAASISIGARFSLPGPGGDGKRPRPNSNRSRRRPNPSSSKPRSSASSSSSQPSSSSGSGQSPSSGSPQNGNAPQPPSGGAGAPAPAAGKCPLRALLPAIGGLIAFPSKMKCPAPICAVRAAIAKTQAVRTLRPHALPVKFAAVSAFTAAVNVPCGAWRENFEKFSPGWFLAVHLTIPVVGMLRKALFMPPYAIAMTIAAAIAGQQIGAKLERYRRARHLTFTTYTPEMAASYGNCPILPLLTETPPNPDFCLQLQQDRWGWELSPSMAARVAVAAAARNASKAAANPLSRGSPLSLAIPVA